MSATIWSDGLGADPACDAAREFERLRGRRVKVRGDLRTAGLAEEAAAGKLAAAQRANRLQRAEKAAMGSPLPAAAVAASLVAAQDATERAAARVADLRDALSWLDKRAEELVGEHAGELLGEVGAGAQAAQQETLRALAGARAALAAWAVAARRQEALLTGAGGAYRATRAPFEELKSAAEALARVEASLPDARLGTEVAA